MPQCLRISKPIILVVLTLQSIAASAQIPDPLISIDTTAPVGAKQLSPSGAITTESKVHFGDAQNLTVPVDNRLRYSEKQIVPVIGLITAGLLSNGKKPNSIKHTVAEERNEHLPNFHTKIDNYVQFSPVYIAYALDAVGVKSKTDIVNRSVILLKAAAINYATVNVLKKLTKTMRPDGSSNNSFPSGHTANAFAAATFLSEEYKEKIPWMPYLAYGIAGSIGACRIANNRHYISDVFVGAGIGILSTKIAYWSHQYRWNKRKTETLVY